MPTNRKPNLPRVEGQPWCAETKRWFRVWRDSPVTDSWDARQWQFLFDTALVHMAVWYDGDLTKAGELRTREAQMGLGFDSQNAKTSPGGSEKASVLSLVISDRKRKASQA
ncbi:hypothetical protein [Tractidigestivibacter sp.]|uniref:phage terminase small subunit n=1 Tax=Tractidigestivibacter sp. TaxID=2847320 RepID=UPI002A90E1A9|nr:hypothetical protein [Tractidigestivibacter sp.]MDY5272091.1 hypothetical protein [Tractidigestivibacter sp.]